jgi:hypothetical protein
MAVSSSTLKKTKKAPVFNISACQWADLTGQFDRHAPQQKT